MVLLLHTSLARGGRYFIAISYGQTLEPRSRTNDQRDYGLSYTPIGCQVVQDTYDMLPYRTWIAPFVAKGSLVDHTNPRPKRVVAMVVLTLRDER
jgi:hypothetical protein